MLRICPCGSVPQTYSTMAAFLRTSGIFCSQASLRTSLSVAPIPVVNSAHKSSLCQTIDVKSISLIRQHYSQSSSYRTYVQSSNSASVQTSNSDSLVHHDPDKWTIKMLYDGDCPLCMREVNMLRERNMRYGTIKFVDISSNNYIAEENAGIDFAMAMGRIHAILRDGTILTDINAFKKLYEEVGLGWVYAFTKIKSIAKIADYIYAVWAKYRLPITGRPSLVEILKKREEEIKGGCNSGQCGIE